MILPHRLRLGSLLLLTLFAGCALESYKARPLDAERSAAAYAVRGTADPGVRDYLRTHGADVSQWPPARWGLPELTLLAFYFHPDLAVARERVRVAQAELVHARAPALAGVSPRLEHHGERRPEDDGPWSLGFEFELPFAGLSRRAALVESGQIEVERAQMAVAESAWTVRARVRATLLALHAALREGDAAEKEAEHSDALVKLLGRRLQEGVAPVGEVTRARLRATQARAELQVRKFDGERALGQLSLALGLPLEVVRALPLSFTAFDTLPAAPDGREVRAGALLNRADVRAALLAYAAAESEVKLQVARQYPEVKLLPGFQWDQGDAVWSLGLGLTLPLTAGSRGAVQVAQARRELAARAFEHMQIDVLARGAAGAGLYRQALEGLRAIEAQAGVAQQHLKETESLFSGGYADRLALVEGRIEALAAAKAAWAARRAALETLGALEDVMQVPLAGGPLPKPPDAPGEAAGVRP